jgi:hypothetical protein
MAKQPAFGDAPSPLIDTRSLQCQSSQVFSATDLDKEALVMRKDFEFDIDGKMFRFSARTGTAHDVGIYEEGATVPCVVLTESNGLERALDSLVDKEELLSLAIVQATQHGLIERARQTGAPVQESLMFVRNSD